MADAETEFEKADELYRSNHLQDAENIFKKLVTCDVEEDDPESIRAKENSVYRLGDIYRRRKNHKALLDLLRNIRPFFSILPKAKTSKIVRNLFDNIFLAGATLADQESISLEMIEWARAAKRAFLRHRLELRLAQVYFDQADALKALSTISSILREVRRLDDKSLLVDTHLLECKVFFSVKNFSKSRAALVAARTNANAIYCPPLAQAEIDLMSGILHLEEKDAKTGFSYMYEAFEGFHGLGDHAQEARRTLKYMILAKILCDAPDELNTVLISKSVLEYTGNDIDALRAVANAYNRKDTHAFNKVLAEYGEVLNADEIIKRHLTSMYDQLLEKHMLRIIEPYNRVQVAYIAEALELPTQLVEQRLSQMILDKKLNGIVDQQNNCLVVFEEVATGTEEKDTLYEDALATLENMDKLVSTLFDKVAGKFDHLIEQAAAERTKPNPTGGKKENAEKTEKPSKK